ncbi:MAG: S8 family serine peptidase [Cyclobacteriaceae bacterium]|nr:S8 family serine peptidase [Cyclobacteriaceae bacterium]MCH8516037.1 S8 family serine peptidase [Cyclobacteriaceae bacterium]
MVKNYLWAFLFSTTLLWGCKDDDSYDVLLSDESSSLEVLLPKNEIDEMIMQHVQDDQEFKWIEADAQVIWSALMHSDSILSIGYQTEASRGSQLRMGEIEVSSPEWTDARNSLVSLITDLENNARPSGAARTLDSRAHEVIPVFEIKVSSLTTVSDLLQDNRVRYMEPYNYAIDLERYVEEASSSSGSGCGSNNSNFNIPNSDFTLTATGARSSWNHDQMGVRDAWAESNGSGITVGVIDTGLSPNQPKMSQQGFASGNSNGRTVERLGFHYSGSWWWKSNDGPDDDCGHGTAMAGVIAAPDAGDGAAVGVAYGANLISIRGLTNVLINSGSERDGVSDALIYLGNRADLNIISMSIGNVFSSGKVADAVRYAHNKGKLIFSAAGTSTSFTNWYGVIFPASMDETIAVTGVKEQASYQRCNTCHSGNKVVFTAVMERAGTDNTVLTTADSGLQPATVGGSSVATATAAGIAALVWSKYPHWNRDQVLQRLTQTADLYPNRNSQFGFGNLNAAAALQGGAIAREN